MPIAKGTHIGPYEIVGWLGAGGMGDVYRARDQRLERDVAIKLLAETFASDASRVRRFDLEARAAGQLNHPNILAVFDTGIDAGAPYVVSELLEGESLRSLLRGGALPWRKAVDYARQIAEGLAAAHDKHIVHRDVKPDNLFVTNDGRIKILDFGIAKLTRPADDRDGHPGYSTETNAGMVIGTAGYMSPEQVRGEAVDARSDLFQRRGDSLRDAGRSSRVCPEDTSRYDGSRSDGGSAALDKRPGATGANRLSLSRENARDAVSVGPRSRVRSGRPDGYQCAHATGGHRGDVAAARRAGVRRHRVEFHDRRCGLVDCERVAIS
jgi:serine/threonine protein kinase